MKIQFLLGFLLLACMVNAQLPETRIYTVDISRSKDLLVFGNSQLISNAKGYNNQPYFSPDGNYIYYASNNGKGNTDIYRYSVEKKSPILFWHKNNKRITKTSESEYSPRLKPDETEITCVRVEKDTVTQHFFAYNTKGKNPHLYIPNEKNIGYYTWFGGADIVAFTLPEPFMLSKINIITMRKDTIASNVGRCFQAYKNKMYYVDKSTVNADSGYAIRMVTPDNLKLRYKDRPKVENPIITFTLPLQEDFVIMNEGTFLMGAIGKLYAYNPKNNKKYANNAWREQADFKTMGLASFYRLALSADNSKLAVVCYAGEKP
jgi:hypothetical protein